MKYILGAVFISLCMFTSEPVCGQYIAREKKMILGTWLAEDNEWTLVFRPDNKCYEYFKKKPGSVYSYRISDDSIQCGEKVMILKKEETSYLQLRDLKSGDMNCYEINGILPKTLSLRASWRGGYILFNRKGK